MNNILLFLLACIPVRLGLCVLAYKLSKKNLPYLGLILAFIGIYFLYLFFTDSRMNAPEAKGHTWWSHYRLMHGMLYLTAGIYALRKENIAWIPLLVDVSFGIVVFSQNRLF